MIPSTIHTVTISRKGSGDNDTEYHPYRDHLPRGERGRCRLAARCGESSGFKCSNTKTG